MKYGILLPNGKTVARKIRYSRNGYNAWVRINKVDFGIEKLDENDKLEDTLLILTIAHSKLDSKYINKISSKDESVWANYGDTKYTYNRSKYMNTIKNEFFDGAK